MQLSAKKGEPGHGKFLMARAEGINIRIWLDGIEQQTNNIVAASEEEGWVRSVVRDARGMIELDDTGENILEETKHGVVKITLGDA